ncbi:DNA-directed RNA polymerase subunit beta' [Candidatus Daviesbacteria bacterium]|nr:DNA-directed RNA polymerase subunit beta' [Candidatus Daviesbacteria bacterium]
MNDLLDFEALRVSIASPEVIRGWSFGEVTKPETINYRTLKAEKDGLFSENIFGPTKDYECYCGKYKRIRYRGVICDKCGVEVTQSKVRRERMGHISLASPVAHIWFVKGAPSKLSLVLDLTMKNLEAVIYFASYLVIEIDPEKKSAALDKLNKQLEQKKKDSQASLDKAVSEKEKELKEKLTELKKKLKSGSKKEPDEKLELAAQDLELQHRQEIAKLREANQVELSQLEEIYKTVSDLVKNIVPLRLLSEDEFYKLEEYQVVDFVKVGMGAEALLEVLQKIDLDKLAADLRVEVSKTSGQRHIKATKRLRLVEGMRQSKINPAWMIMTVLPVLPPDLRPMVQLPGGRFATSDLNDLYRRVINRNNRLKRLIELGAPEIILRNEKRMLQEAVDSLIDSNTRTARRTVGSHQLRSLSDMLRGKQGRFRQNLLGKRVDYSGRSVIIVGPKLKLHQVGLPKEMALEMFKPFILRELISRGLSSNVKGAKNVLEFRPPEVWDILEEVIENHPVLINRAPTLHRLGIQAFFPILIDGNAIQIHPCICAGFNADFDGDQMAVHVPLSQKAMQEAISLMMAKENILKPSDSSPINVPNREMALGSYYVTSIDQKLEALDKVFYKEEAILAYQTGKLELRRLMKAKINDEMIETTVGRILFNEALPQELRFINETMNSVTIRRIVMDAFKKFEREKVEELIDSIKDFGFWGATISGLSLSIPDNRMIEEKAKLIEHGDKEIAGIEENLKRGLITNEERRALAQEVWTRVGDEIVKKTISSIEPDSPIQIIINSGGARATTAQIAQTAGMRGFSVDPTGKIVELPTKSNYREGLGVFEYFTSCRGARKGVADKSLRTADAGYLTRRLVDVSHDVIIRLEDCGGTSGLILPIIADNFNSNLSRFLGRKVVNKVVDPKSRKVIVGQGGFIEETEAQAIVKSGIKEVAITSPLTCNAKFGICSSCYGLDLSNRKPVAIGTPVGVIAAQAIGEPGTQLSMRTFHSGGVVGVDITQGLPRVEELFEARTPKIVSPISEIAGKVTVSETDQGRVIRVRTVSKPHEEREYLISATSDILVEDGDLISAGSPLASGHLDITEVLRIKGLQEAQRYIVEEARKVYESQGVQLNEKHFEVIVRKMSDKVRIESQGDTVLLPGEIVDRNRFEEENTRVLAEGGEPSTAGVIILGITRASLQTESFLSAASFQETTTVLADAASVGKKDNLLGLKENVIIGRLIPTSPERAKLE